MNLFVSALTLDRAASKELKITDTYSLHRVVYSLFDDVRNSAQKRASVRSGIQWVDKGEDANGHNVLILSDREPKPKPHCKIRTKTIPESLFGHKHYRFEVVINPVRHFKSKKVPVRGRQAISDWLIEKSEQWGFSVDASLFNVEKVKILKFEKSDKHHDGKLHSVTIQQAKISGILTVTDSEIFEASVAKGIGRGRSFGCGLLQILPVQEPSNFQEN